MVGSDFGLPDRPDRLDQAIGAVSHCFEVVLWLVGAVNVVFGYEPLYLKPGQAFDKSDNSVGVQANFSSKQNAIYVHRAAFSVESAHRRGSLQHRCWLDSQLFGRSAVVAVAKVSYLHGKLCKRLP